MNNIDLRILKAPGETNKAYRIRLYMNKELYVLDNITIGRLCNEAFGVNFDESAHRKKAKNYIEGYNDAKKEIGTNDTKLAQTLKEIEDKTLEMQLQEVRFRDERNELSRSKYNFGRWQAKIDYFEKVLKESGERQFSPAPAITFTGNNDLLVMLSDLHIGACFDSFLGTYNSDIAKKRLEKYLTEIIAIQELHHSENCYISLLGDCISSNIHKQIAVTNRENVIEQIKLAGEYVANFVYELSKHFKSVALASVNGNHSRIDRKEDALKDERLDDLIGWYVEAKLSHIPNFKLLNTNVDSTIASLTIRGNTFIGVHGDYDSFNEASVSKLVLTLGYRPYAVLYGHKHFPAMSEVAGIRIIQCGSLGGSGDDYTVEKRLFGKPSQTVCVCTEQGIKAYYPIEL